METGLSFWQRLGGQTGGARDLILLAVLSTFGLDFPWSPTREQNLDNTQASRLGHAPTAARADQKGQSAVDHELARKIRSRVHR
jgi:hypothetical protein